jgi:hypothetical protein
MLQDIQNNTKNCSQIPEKLGVWVLLTTTVGVVVIRGRGREGATEIAARARLSEAEE